MKIGILGSGNVGTRAAELAKAVDHDVVVGNRSGDVSLGFSPTTVNKLSAARYFEANIVADATDRVAQFMHTAL